MKGKITGLIALVVVASIVMIGATQETKAKNDSGLKPPQQPSEEIDEKPRMCNRMYAPVCGVDGKTYGNSCTAGDVEIAYEGECKQPAKDECESIGGKYVESANECEGITHKGCEKLGGQFNECGSACRNDPDAEFCTMQCVQYCVL